MKATVLLLKTVAGIGLAGQTVTTDDTDQLTALSLDDQLVILSRESEQPAPITFEPLLIPTPTETAPARPVEEAPPEPEPEPEPAPKSRKR